MADLYLCLGALVLFTVGFRLVKLGNPYKRGGGDPYTELSRNSMEDAYSAITSEARNQYTLGYIVQPVKGSSAYRSLEVVVYRKDVSVYTKSGYYPMPAAH